MFSLQTTIRWRQLNSMPTPRGGHTRSRSPRGRWIVDIPPLKSVVLLYKRRTVDATWMHFKTIIKHYFISLPFSRIVNVLSEWCVLSHSISSQDNMRWLHVLRISTRSICLSTSKSCLKTHHQNEAMRRWSSFCQHVGVIIHR